ncbi:Crp/Fnr family transcriptional regulator [Anaerobacillus sp. MEB173]|uniref:Crp/Fnr family transcriptional regulator n=1 Tax=Anaerobacillus sp. MEB173 TaxID=3383345 RepID=UPI003F93EF21
MKVWIDLLKQMDFFKGLSHEEMEPLLQNAIEKTFHDKEILFSEGEDREYLYVLRRGTVLISKLSEEGEERVINILYRGDIFPHTGFFDDRPYPGTASAKKDVEVLMIPIRAFETFIESHPHLAFRIIKSMSKKIYLLQGKLNELLSLNVEERLVAAIKKIKDENGENIHLTHQELGNIVGASRETISRQLKKLEKQGRVRMTKNGIVLVDEE